ncbi:MAG TPA: hypothetical protein VMB03_03710 [Bryobacteraceae bacterium]|nr:hypothetical protein [Bryobacteraceae bacterium]
MAAAGSLLVPAAERSLRLAPTLPDLFFALLLAAQFGRVDAWQGLLADGDTGWHIRTGDYIAAHGVPVSDLFSFSRAGQPWYAWEWLSDIIFAYIHQWFGLPGVAALGAILVCLAATLLFAWLLRRGAGAWVALPVTLAATNAASVHNLARPHLLSLVLLVAGLWLLDEDRRAATAWLWILVPVTGLWANLHGGFAAWLAILVFLAAGSALERNWIAWKRYGLLAGFAAMATLINPYGWQLHRHIWEYLGSRWIARNVQEFQSPQIRSENMLVFAVLLLAGVAVAGKVCRRSQWFEPGLVAICGFVALRSARYVPIFAVVSAPLLGAYAARSWEDSACQSDARGTSRVLWESSRSLGARWQLTAWMPILGALALLAIFPSNGLWDFPARSFPVNAVAQNAGLLAGPARILTSDQWADYLIYRLYPRRRVFFDGRSDFYGEDIGNDYRALMMAGRSCRDIMARYGFTAALLPLDWPLGQVLERDPSWRVAYRDGQAVLLVAETGFK